MPAVELRLLFSGANVSSGMESGIGLGSSTSTHHWLWNVYSGYGVSITAWQIPIAIVLFVFWLVQVYLWLVYFASVVHKSYCSCCCSSPKISPSLLNIESTLPGISILRPLEGLDPKLEENLECLFKFDYPQCQYEVILCIPNPDNPARTIAEKVIERYPNINARLFIGERIVGINPKINNLITGYEQSKYDIVWISDSNVYFEPTVMTEAALKIQEDNVGVVHHLPIGVGVGSFGGLLEAVYLGNYHPRYYISLNRTKDLLDHFGIKTDTACIIGKSTMFHKKHFDNVGGLSYFGKYLGEDFMMGCHFARQGLRLVVADHLAFQSLGENWAVKDYVNRRIRWGRLRKVTIFLTTCLEPFTGCLGLGFVICALTFLLSLPLLYFFVAHVIVWFLGDIFMYYTLTKSKGDLCLPLKFIAAWIFAEIAYFPIFFYIMIGNQVEWRGKIYKMKFGGEADRIDNL